MQSHHYPILPALFAFALGLALSPSVAPASSADHDSYSGFALESTPTLPEAERHPSLWFDASEIQAAISKRKRDDHASRLWTAIKESPFVCADLRPAPTAQAGKTLIHQYYGHMTQIAAYSAFMSLASSDPTERDACFEVAKNALLRAFDGPIYELDPLIKGSAVDEIYQGVWMQNYAMAYDWIQPRLSEADDRAIRERLVRQARYVHENLMSWADSPHNHLSKPAWGLGSLALVLSGHAEASAWLARAIEASNANTRYFFSKDGIYREGSHYYIFSLINAVPFLYHYRNVSGVDGFAVFQPAFEWPVLTRNGKGWMPNIEDSYIRPFPSQLVAGAYLDKPTRLHQGASLGQVLQWNFENTDYAPFEDSKAETGFNYTGATWDYPLPLVEYLAYQPGIEAAPPSISGTVFMESGQTAFRNDWSFADPNHRYLLFHGVAEADNHAHADHLSFIIQAENQMMASDSGYTRTSFRENIRETWYVTARAHNLAMANGEAPVDPAESQAPASLLRVDTGFFDCETKQAPYPSGGHHRRTVAFPDQSYWIVLDRIELPEEGAIENALHGGRGYTRGVGQQRIWEYSDDRYGPESSLQWSIASDPPLTLEDKVGELTYIKGDFGRFPYASAKVQSSDAIFLQVLVPAGDGEEGPHVTDYTREGITGLQLRWANIVDSHRYQREPQLRGFADVASDGTYAYVRQEQGKGISQAAAIEATELSMANQPIIKTSKASFIAGKLVSPNRWEVVLDCQESAEASIQWHRLPAGGAIEAEVIEGNASVSNTGASSTVAFQGRATLSVVRN